jgi:CRP-like cAMP-binding protein
MSNAKRSAVTAPLNDDLNVPALLASAGVAEEPVTYRRNAVIVTQGEPCRYVFYLQTGRVKLSVRSKAGRGATLETLGCGHFFGEDCLIGETRHRATAIATTNCQVVWVAKDQMLRVLQTEHALANRFIAHLLARNIRIQEALLDQMFEFSESRLARTLLLLAGYDAAGNAAPHDSPPRTIERITQEALAEMVGTSRSRVSILMKKFERLGFIDAKDGTTVHPSLRSVVTSDSIRFRYRR